MICTAGSSCVTTEAVRVASILLSSSGEDGLKLLAWAHEQTSIRGDVHALFIVGRKPRAMYRKNTSEKAGKEG